MFGKKQKKEKLEEGEEGVVTPPVVDEPEAVSEVVNEPEQSGVPERRVKEPNEAFFGTLLIISFGLCLLATLGYFGYAGYQIYRGMQSEKAIPSIDALPRIAENTPPAESATPTEETKTETPASAIDKKTLVVKVLNGGAAKGSAGTYAETLKKAGYTQTTFGNPFGSYTGVTLYYATGKEKEAEALKQDVIVTYPKVVVKVAPAGDKDASAAPFVVILGQ